MNEAGKLIFICGIALAVVGLALWTGVGRGWFGKLPGDIHISRGSFNFYFPLVTCLLISVVLTLLLWFLRR